MTHSEQTAEMYSKGLSDGIKDRPVSSSNPDYTKGYEAGQALVRKEKISLDRLMGSITNPREQ